MTKKKKWRDLSDAQRVGVILMSILQVALLFAALWDISQRTDEEINGDKSVWQIVVFINFIGPLAYFSFGRKPAAEAEA